MKQEQYNTTCGGSGTASFLWHLPLGTPQPGIICLSLLQELQCSTPRLAWVRQSGVHQGIPARPDPNGGGRCRCHPMVHGGRGKHPALPLRYHLLGQLHIRWSIQGGASIPPCFPGTIVRCTWHPGAGIIVTLPATVIQAGLYSGARGRLGGSKLPADFILLTSSLITLHSET
jgi:hypothetical protein